MVETSIRPGRLRPIRNIGEGPKIEALGGESDDESSTAVSVSMWGGRLLSRLFRE